jgi:CDP-glucose 4,6-dehydratase
MMDALTKAYRGKTVMVTGHTGFKGSWLALWLMELGVNVIGYGLEPVSDKGNFTMSGIKDKMMDIRGDIRDYDKLQEVFEKYKPEIVFHLAAQPLVRYSYEHPRCTYEINVMGTLNVLDAIRKCENTRAGVIISSDKCYENREWIWGYRENDFIGGYDPYSSSKGCVELLASSYRNSYFNINKYEEHKKLLSTARAGNVIGGGDWATSRILPDCISALEDNKDIVIRNPEAVRPWQHVLEPLSGYLMLGERMLKEDVRFSGAWNFGPEASSIVTVEEVVRKVIKYWGKGNFINQSREKTVFHEANLLSLDINKARYYLNWYPRWNVDKAIEKTVEWYKNYSTKNVYELCKKQIGEYCNS